MRNPFTHIRNWVKGEIMDYLAILECIQRKVGVEAAKNKAIVKLRDNKEVVDKMSHGRFTMKGLFRSQTAKANETQTILQTISQTEQDIKNYEVIKNFLIVYLNDIAIPAFKYQKMSHYMV